MKTNKKVKFSFEKFEIAKLKKTRIKGGGDTEGDPDTGTNTSKNCSKRPGCRNPDPNDPNNPNDPDPSITDLYLGI